MWPTLHIASTCQFDIPTSNNIADILRTPFLFAAFAAANFQIDFFGNPVMRTAE